MGEVLALFRFLAASAELYLAYAASTECANFEVLLGFPRVAQIQVQIQFRGRVSKEWHCGLEGPWGAWAATDSAAMMFAEPSGRALQVGHIRNCW